MNQMGIFFDLDGTLVHTTSSREERFLNLSKETGLSFTLQEVREAYRYTDKWWRKKGFKLSDWTRKNFVQLNYVLLKNLGVDSNRKDLAQEIMDLWEKIPWSKPYPEVNDTLQILKDKSFRLGILSHRSPEGIKRVVSYLGWQNHFHCLISPVEAKTRQGKRDPRMWGYGLEKMGLKASRVIHVGDEYENDILGAEKIGILPVLIDRDNRYRNKNLHCYIGKNLKILFKFIN